MRSPAELIYRNIRLSADELQALSPQRAADLAKIISQFGFIGNPDRIQAVGISYNLLRSDMQLILRVMVPTISPEIRHWGNGLIATIHRFEVGGTDQRPAPVLPPWLTEYVADWNNWVQP